MKALILNSGLGSRMGIMASEQPKCMTKISNSETILSRQLKQLVDAGIDDPVLFELVGIFQENIGPDRISDMVAKIIIDDLILYTQRICKELGIPLKSGLVSQ